MSDKEIIHDMVNALARSKTDPSFLDVAREKANEVMAAKTERQSDEMFEKVEAEDQNDDVVEEGEASDDDEESDSIGEGSLDRAARRHARAGHRDLNAKKRAVAKPARDRMADTSAE